ncbi:MAG: hypothetical protein LPK80_10930 [Bacteroidota bacterium]|nr:hypothetical protein [Bacteroidota bacterium]
MAVAALSVSLTSCKKEDDPTPENPMPQEATLMVSSQVISQNMIEVEMVNVPEDGWVVVHADNGNGGPMVPDIISEPTMVKAGGSSSVMVKIAGDATIQDGDKVWIMLHKDTGTKGQYEFDGQNDLDPPYIKDGSPVMDPIMIESAKINVNDMQVMNNTVVIPEVIAAVDGWLVIHNDNGMGGIVLPGIIGKTMVKAGVNTNVTVQLDQNVTIMPGQNLFPMLHLDNGIIGTYEFDGQSQFDGPEIFGNDPFPGNVIFTSFTVLQ